MIESYSKDTLWFIPVVAGLAGLLPRNSQEWKEPSWRGDLMKATVLLAAGGFLILVPQWIVYGGNSLAGRYLTPGNLFIVFAAALGLYLCSNNFGEQGRAELRGVVAGMLIRLRFSDCLEPIERPMRQRFPLTSSRQNWPRSLNSKRNILSFHCSFTQRTYLIASHSFQLRASWPSRLPNPEQPFLNPFDWETGADSLRKKRLAKLIREESLEGESFSRKSLIFVVATAGVSQLSFLVLPRIFDVLTRFA